MNTTNDKGQAAGTHAHKNEVHLAGELGQDPKVIYTSSGKAVSSFSVLTKYQQSTEYHRVTAWEGLAEKAGKLSKGEFVKIVGRLHTRSWEDKRTNQKKFMTEVVVWQLLPGKDKAVQNAHGVETSDHDTPF